MSSRTLPLPSPGDRLLFVRFSSLGDVLLSMKKAKAIKDRFPEIHLAWLTSVEYQGLIGMQPYVDEVIGWDSGMGKTSIIGTIRKIRRAGFRWLYSVHNNDRCALVSLFSGIPFRFGHYKFTDLPYDFDPSVADRVWGLVCQPDMGHALYVSQDSVKEMGKMIPGAEKSEMIFCVIGASKKYKQWPLEHWIVFCKGLISKGFLPVLVGNGKDEEDMARVIVSKNPGDVLDLVGKLSLENVCALASLSRIAVGGDTGPLHLARMVGIPCIGLFAIEDPARYGHIGDNLLVLKADPPYGNYSEIKMGTEPLDKVVPKDVISEIYKLEIMTIRQPGKAEK